MIFISLVFNQFVKFNKIALSAFILNIFPPKIESDNRSWVMGK